jgi:hypothetical protein
LTPEPDFKATPAQIASISAAVLRQLAETHVIITKDELRALVSKSLDTHTEDIFHLILGTYRTSAEQLAEVLPPAQLKGFELGEKLVLRMKSVVMEENSLISATSHPENQ